MYSSTNIHSDRILGVSEIRNGIIVPSILENNNNSVKGGVLDENFHYISTSAYTNDPCAIAETIGKEYRLANLKITNDSIIYIGQLYYVYGHAITDNLSKLWFLLTNEAKLLIESGVKLGYTSMLDHEVPNYVEDLCSYLGIELSQCIKITQPIQYATVYIPESSLYTEKRISGSYKVYTNEYKKTIQHIKEQIYDSYKCSNIQTYEKIYLTRTKFASNNRDSNEKEVESFFESLGYTIISPELYSLEEQIFMLGSAKEIAVTEGSIALTTQFCNKGTKLYLLLKCNWINDYQWCANEIAQLNTTYISVHQSDMNNKMEPWQGPFYLYVTPYLQQWGKKLFNILPYFFKLSYWKYRKPYWLRLFKKIFVK
jgi:capsular polysaccharide biosynthesis protein